MTKRTITVDDRMQKGYQYELVKPAGRSFDSEFIPDFTPAEMLRLGVFGSKYMTDCTKEFPPSWFSSAKLAGGHSDSSLNFFGVDASQPLSVWRKKGWIHPDDPRGWFQWYCRYYMGRRLPEEDARQIKRCYIGPTTVASCSCNTSPLLATDVLAIGATAIAV